MTDEEWVEKEVAAYIEKVYPDGIDAHTRSMLYKKFRTEQKIWQEQNADYSPADAGEPPESAQW